MPDQPTTNTLQLGPGGPAISPLGIGTWAWGDRMVWGYGSGDYSDSDLREAFRISIEAGITFFDTAEVYGMGRSETILGENVRAAGAKVVIATKFFPFPWRLGRGTVVRALRRSLARLGVEQVDLYQIHWPTPLVAVDTLINGLADAVEAGLTKTVGVSNYNVEQMRQAHEALARRGVPLTSNQVQYSLVHRQPERSGLSDVCRELGITLIAYSPLGMGTLTGKYTPENPPPGTRGRRYSREFLSNLQPLIAKMRDIGATHGDKTPAQVALNWVMGKGAVPIPGAKNARQAQDNVEALNWSLTEAELAALDAASQHVE
jgi:aryl-alcohol dehydrogenase-like predicted oxidoreductase